MLNWFQKYVYGNPISDEDAQELFAIHGILPEDIAHVTGIPYRMGAEAQYHEQAFTGLTQKIVGDNVEISGRFWHRVKPSKEDERMPLDAYPFRTHI